MKATVTPMKPLTYDPYEEDCTGAHDGEVMDIILDGHVTLQIQELRSGIGNTYSLVATCRGREKRKQLWMDDDGDFYFE